MTDKKDLDNVAGESALRDAAEDQVGKSPDASHELEDLTSEKIIHELRVHQVELEIQNDELKRVQLELEASRDKFQDLYDSVPVGYFTLTHKGLIKEVNRTGALLLGMPRSKLINMRFGGFVASESDDQWYRHIISALGHEEKQSCVLTLKREDGSSFYARLESVQQVAPVELRKANGGTLVVNVAVTDITERKRIEETLLASEERFRRMFESHSAIMLLIEPVTGKILDANRAAERFYGYTTTRLRSMSIWEINILPPDDVQKERNLALTEQRNYFIFPHRLADGQVKTVEVHSSPIEQNGEVMLFSIIHDITERNHAEEMLRIKAHELNERLKELNCLYAISKLLVSSDESLDDIFQGIVDLVPISWQYPEIACASLTLQDREFKTKNYEIPISRQSADIHAHGERIGFLEVAYFEETPLGDEGPFMQEEKRLLNSIAERLGRIVEREQLKTERLELERKLLDAQKLQGFTVMAGGIAHDFNNLLMAILGNLELALDDRTLSAEGKKAIENAIQATDRSAELSHQMLIYSGKLFYVPKDLDLCELAYKNEDLLKSIIPKTTTFHFEIHKGHLAIRGDADQIQRLIANLVINASEAIGEITGDVTIMTGVMDCDAAYLSNSHLEIPPEPGQFVFLEVADTGCGMDAETQRKLFDPFFTTKFWGRGLGMAEVMGIVKGHHGAIIVNSAVGKGTTIRVLFPAPKEALALPAQVVELVETRSPASDVVSRRKTVLVVEDEAGVRNLVVRRLDVLGYDTIAAVDGVEGVRIFRERLNEIDLALLDFAMPRMNGVEAFEELIRIKPDVKVILSSGYTEDIVLQSFPDRRPAGILHKPYKTEDLKAALDRLLGHED